jgi:hypothetical protein
MKSEVQKKYHVHTQSSVPVGLQKGSGAENLQVLEQGTTENDFSSLYMFFRPFFMIN